MRFLEVGTGNAQRILSLRNYRVTIGRSDENDLILAQDPTVSRQHAVLEHVDDAWRIRDLGSSNGTFVNGIRVTTSMQVNPGDRVSVGSSSLMMVDGAENLLSAAGKTVLVDADCKDTLGLSKRETEVLRLVAGGLTDGEIAEQLFISVKTVHSHLDRIRDKSGLRRRVDLTRLAIELGLDGSV
ncbi:MAG: FHA domain-containing protein [Candidatus Nanopelagicales bacterium]